MGSFYRKQLEDWISNLDIVADTVIDIGGSQKPMTKRNIKRWDVKNYIMIDNQTYPEGEGVKPDYFADANFELSFDDLNKSADVLICFEVGEYIFDPVQWHENMFRLLKDNGVAYISYPTIYPLHNPPGIDYLRYSKNAIEKLLSHVGFSSWEITPRVATNGARALGDFYVLEQMRPMRSNDIYNIGYMVKAIK